MLSSYRYCRVAPCCSASSAGFVANKLAGAPLHSLPGGRAVVPLLHPQQHGLPFALTLELHTAPAPPPPPRDARSAADPVYALHYVLAGSGQLVRPHGAAEPLQAGDAVLMHAGAAACCAAAGGEGLGGADASLGAPVHMAELVALMPSQLFEQQQQRGEQPGVQPSSLALPLPQPDGGSGAPVQCLSEELAAALLAGAKATARQAVLYNQAAAAAAAQRRPGTPSSPLQLLQAAVGGLSAWWQAQQGRTCPVTKRTLAELTAFQLPNQSNRLAVQFDPFTQPQVPFISGVEVFEPGHRTTPHVHPQAHELFFILAGEGVGFCGDRRFPVAAGDVVVFRPGARHGIDNGPAARMYCLELMVPNEEFAEFVRMGTDTGALADDDMCVLASIGCR